MSTRSPYNDRSKTEQKGKTRKSAAASKPKREAGVAASAAPSKKAPAKKKSLWSRGPAKTAVAQPVQSPEMKRLRRLWWILWGSSLGVALVAVFVGQFAKTNTGLEPIYSVLLGLWAASFAGVIYLEFGPIRKARMAAIEESKAPKGKKGKAAKVTATPATEIAPVTVEKPTALSKIGTMFGRSKPAEGVHEVPGDTHGSSSGKDGDA